MRLRSGRNHLKFVRGPDPLHNASAFYAPCFLVLFALTRHQDLVSVRKNGTTGKLEIAPCNVYRIPGTSGGHFGSGEDRISESPHHVCIVAVDLAKKRATVLRNEFTPFW